MTDSRPDSEQKPPDDDRTRRTPVPPAPFWRKPAFAIVAMLIALIGMVWRCA
jgi:hypothetical protein